MKILQVTPRFYPSTGGVESAVRSISRRLVERGHDVTVYTSTLYCDSPPVELPRDSWIQSINGISVRRFRGFSLVRGHGAGVVSPRMLFEMIRELDFDILHAHSYLFFSSYASVFAKMLRNVRFVLTPHLSPHGAKSLMVRRILETSLGRLMLERADCVIVLSEKERDFVQRAGADSSRIHIISHGVEAESFAKSFDDRVSTFRKKFGLGENVVLFVGRLAPNKGLGLLLEAAGQVLNQIPDVQFAIVGQDWGLRRDLLRRSIELGISDRVVFTGPVSDDLLVGAYLSSRVVTFPSTGGEAFGLVVLEAMAAGKPVVAFKGIAPDILQDGRNGLLAKYGSSNDFARNIVRLLNDEDLTERIAANNRTLAKSHTWDEATNDHELLYRSLARQVG